MENYNRYRAVEYAIKYGLDPNAAYKLFDGEGGDCTNFISQCLLAGNIPMDRGSNYPWWYTSRNWSFSWSVAHSLYWCIKNRSASRLKGLRGIEVANYDMLDLGDLIQYERNGRIYHTGIITNWDNDFDGRRFPLISQHSYYAVNISWIKPVADRVHFIKIG